MKARIDKRSYDCDASTFNSGDMFLAKRTAKEPIMVLWPKLKIGNPVAGSVRNSIVA